MEAHGEIHTRKCKDCGLVSEDLTKFVKNKGSKYGRRNLCIKCAIIRNEKESKHKDWKTDHQTKKRYGVDVKTYKERMSQHSCCNICGSKENLCYDHDHVTMEFRGVLCRSCNSAIGQLGDTVEGLQKALDYLKEHHENLTLKDTH